MIFLVAIFLGAYLVGSVSTGFLVARAYGINDIKKHGSGNTGATNVARTLGKKFFIVVLLGDALKAYLYCLVLIWCGLQPMLVYIGAALLLVGNGYSCFLSFAGGKGVATVVGILCALHPALFGMISVVWASTFIATRTVGIASVVGCLSAPLFSYFYFHDSTSMVVFITFVALWIVGRHTDNIKRYVSSYHASA